MYVNIFFLQCNLAIRKTNSVSVQMITWHASMFDSFCSILQAANINFGKFDRVAHPTLENCFNS